MTFDLPTFLFQTVNFIVLLVILHRLLWVPLRRHMAERSRGIAEQLDEIERAREEVVELKASAERELEEVRQRQAELVEEAKGRAERAAGEILETARVRAEEERQRSLARLEAEQHQSETEFLRSLGPRVTSVLDRMLKELGAADLHDRACERLAAHLAGLEESRRAELGETGRKAGVELVTASAEFPEALSDALAGLLPDGVPAERRVDPSLIAGARLRIGETVLDGSLQGQVEQVLGVTA